MKQKIIWQIYLFSKGNYFLEINSVLNFSLSALQGLVYKKALKKKKEKKRQADATSSFTIMRDSISAKLACTLVCYSSFYLWSQSQGFHALAVNNALNFKKFWELK